MKLKHFLVVFLFLPTLVLAYNQKYISANVNSKQINTMQQQTNKNTQPMTPSSETVAAPGYSAKAKKNWFKHCLSSVKNPSMQSKAFAFCNCGWQHISKGELPASYLASEDPQTIQKANKILNAISQQCLVRVWAGSK